MELIKKRLKESLDFTLVESLLDEDYPSSFNMEEFKKLTKFSQRIKYCEEHLKRISSGSARIVYMIDDTKVLKLSKNQKGLAQTEVEIQWGQDSYFSNILAHTFEYHPDDYWIEMELARKVNKNTFKQITGVDVSDLSTYLHNQFAVNNPSRRLHTWGQDPKIKEQMDENEFAQSIMEFMFQIDAPAGDFGMLSSYGLVKRNGQDDIVLIDFGLTNDVYQTYYT